MSRNVQRFEPFAQIDESRWLLFGVWCVEVNDKEYGKQETKQGMFDVWLVNNI